MSDDLRIQIHNNLNLKETDELTDSARIVVHLDVQHGTRAHAKRIQDTISVVIVLRIVIDVAQQGADEALGEKRVVPLPVLTKIVSLLTIFGRPRCEAHILIFPMI